VNISDKQEVWNRSNYDLLTLIGDFGGIAEFLHVFIGFFMAGISSMQLKSLLANRFYQWSRPELYREKVMPISAAKRKKKKDGDQKLKTKSLFQEE
jgi:hypothetical protein